MTDTQKSTTALDSSTTKLNLARIVYRLMTSPRGWNLRLLREELAITQRTERKYRQILTEQFPYFTQGGLSRLEVVGEREQRTLRLKPEASARAEDELPAQLIALHMATTLLGFLQKTDIAQAAEGLTQELRRRAGRQTAALNHFTANAKRLLYTVPDAPKSYEDKRGILRELINALVQCERIRMVYEGSNSSAEPRERTLEPLSLVSWRSGLYLLARESSTAPIKTYAVDRIVELSRTGEPFAYPSLQDFDPARFTEGCFGIFRDQHDDPIPVELLFADLRWLKIYLQERTWHPTQRFEELEDGRLKMTFKVSSMMEVWPWIRQFGEDVEVCKPLGAVPPSFSAQ